MAPFLPQRSPSRGSRAGWRSQPARAKDWWRKPIRLKDWWLAVAALPLLVFIVLPVVSLVLKSPLETLQTYLVAPATQQALQLSLLTSTVSAAVVIVLGTPLAYLLARRRFPGQRLVEARSICRPCWPPAVAGLALLMAFGRRGVLGPLLDSAGIDIAFSTVAVIMAQMFVAAPYFIKTATVGLAS